MLNLLSKQSIPQGGEDGSAGFLFFETADGYHFKSIDKLFDKQQKRNHIFLIILLMQKKVSQLVMMEKYYNINQIVL